MAKKGDTLIIPDAKQLRNRKEAEWGEFLAILIPGKNNKDCPINLVTVRAGNSHGEETIKEFERLLLIDMVKKEVVEQKWQAQIEQSIKQ